MKGRIGVPLWELSPSIDNSLDSTSSYATSSSHASSSTSSSFHHRPSRLVPRSTSKKPAFVPSTMNREGTSVLVSMIKDVSKQVDQNSDAKRRYFARLEEKAKKEEKARKVAAEVCPSAPSPRYIRLTINHFTESSGPRSPGAETR